MFRLIKSTRFKSRRPQTSKFRSETLEARRVLAAVPFSEQIIIDDIDADGATAIATADIDGDSDLDVIVGSYRDDRVSWFKNDGNQNFERVTISESVDEVRDVLAVDIDGDGDTDVVAAAYGSDQVIWFENEGAGSFKTGVVITSATNGAYSLDAADMDNDGDLDLVSASVLDNTVAWYENLGEGFFGIQEPISETIQRPRSVKIADLDGDNQLDVVVAARFDDRISWFGGDGNGNFSDREDINGSFNSPEDIDVGDIDGDGDIDIISAMYTGAEILWHRNQGDGTFDNEIQMAGGPLRGKSVDLVDLDGDGDLDAIAGSYFNDEEEEDKVVWFDNTDGNGDFKREQFIALNDTIGVTQVLAGDLDNDGDMDVMSASQIDNKVTWHENNGSARFGPQISVVSDAGGAATMDVADIDGDGDLDLVVSSFWDNGVAWYENLGNAEFSTERVITNSAGRVQGVRTGDMDGDGDIDVLAAAYRSDKISWYKNDGNGNFGPAIHINTFANGALDVYVADLDNDGDLDVISGSIIDSVVAWYENTDGQGTFSNRRVVSQIGVRPEWVSAADIDGDSDLDILAASYEDGRVVWIENRDGNGDFSGGINTVHLGQTADTVDAIDIDGDGDMDLAVTLYQTGNLVWYENTDGQGTFSDTNELVLDGLVGVDTLFIADIDGNGSEDMLTASSTEVVWAERTGDTFDFHTITNGNVNTVLDVHAVDIDQDGDIDVLSTSILDSKVALYRNETPQVGVIEGDFNNDKIVNEADIDLLCAEVRNGQNADRFDLNNDDLVDAADLDAMLTDILKTSIGDSNLDGIFNSSDLVKVFQAGQYEDGIAGNSGWAEGDWNCSGDFDTADLVAAFEAGSFVNAAVSAAIEDSQHRLDMGIAAALEFDSYADDRLVERTQNRS